MIQQIAFLVNTGLAIAGLASIVFALVCMFSYSSLKKKQGSAKYHYNSFLDIIEGLRSEKEEISKEIKGLTESAQRLRRIGGDTHLDIK